MKFYYMISVGLGGFIGSVVRYIVSLKMNEILSTSLLPLGTLLVNVVGSFVIGLILEFATFSTIPPTLRLFLTTGILGGLTTFSTFSYETVALFTNAFYSAAVMNVFLNVGLGLGGAYLGKLVADVFLRLV